jgi:hypothetical protein
MSDPMLLGLLDRKNKEPIKNKIKIIKYLGLGLAWPLDTRRLSLVFLSDPRLLGLALPLDSRLLKKLMYDPSQIQGYCKRKLYTILQR